MPAGTMKSAECLAPAALATHGTKSASSSPWLRPLLYTDRTRNEPDMPVTARPRSSSTALLFGSVWLLCAAASASPADQVDAVADEFYQAVLAEQPEAAYFAGVELERHDGLTDWSPAALARWSAREDEWLERLRAIDTRGLVDSPQAITYAVLTEHLEASHDLRVCHREHWYRVNHMDSWHHDLAAIAARQPVGTAAQRAQALARWQQVPAMIRQEIANLRAGLDHGYSAARPVAQRMLDQIEGLIAAEPAGHPYASPAERSADAEFAGAYRQVIEDQVLPALREYRDFLATSYVARARADLAISSLPEGSACYAAMLRSYTTVARSAAEVKAIGERVVAQNRADVVDLGRRIFRLDTMPAIIEASKSAGDNQYADTKATLDAARQMVARAQTVMPRLFGNVPPQAVVVEPVPEYQDVAGASSHYEPPQADGTPGIYRISLLTPGSQRCSQVEIAAFHETWPGHHLQLAYAQRVTGLHPANRLVFNSGFVEGWARYAEALAEEAGLYQTQYAKIERRAWPARGMVVDPGVHAFGWSREQAVEFIVEAGRTRESAMQMVDRIAALPGQLTAYDTGAQEFFALRRSAEAELGDRFDLRRFHDAVLGGGTVPLSMLRSSVERWLADEKVRLPLSR